MHDEYRDIDDIFLMPHDRIYRQRDVDVYFRRQWVELEMPPIIFPRYAAGGGFITAEATTSPPPTMYAGLYHAAESFRS